MSFYPDFIQILYKFYPDFFRILSRLNPESEFLKNLDKVGKNTLPKFYPDFIQILFQKFA